MLARAFAFDGDLSSAPQTERLWSLAESLLPAQGIEPYTQGLMDLGAGVCLTRSPHCLLCPLADVCQARAQGRPEAFPIKTRKLRRTARSNAWLQLTWQDQVWLVQRPQRGVWAGLWSLPEFESVDEAQAALAALPGRAQAGPPIVHSLTHFDWTLLPLHWALPTRLPERVHEQLAQHWPTGRWVGADEALTLGIPTPLRRLLESAAAG